MVSLNSEKKLSPKIINISVIITVYDRVTCASCEPAQNFQFFQAQTNVEFRRIVSISNSKRWQHWWVLKSLLSSPAMEQQRDYKKKIYFQKSRGKVNFPFSAPLHKDPRLLVTPSRTTRFNFYRFCFRQNRLRKETFFHHRCKYQAYCSVPTSEHLHLLVINQLSE